MSRLAQLSISDEEDSLATTTSTTTATKKKTTTTTTASVGNDSESVSGPSVRDILFKAIDMDEHRSPLGMLNQQSFKDAHGALAQRLGGAHVTLHHFKRLLASADICAELDAVKTAAALDTVVRRHFDGARAQLEAAQNILSLTSYCLAYDARGKRVARHDWCVEGAAARAHVDRLRRATLQWATSGGEARADAMFRLTMVDIICDAYGETLISLQGRTFMTKKVEAIRAALGKPSLWQVAIGALSQLHRVRSVADFDALADEMARAKKLTFACTLLRVISYCVGADETGAPVAPHAYLIAGIEQRRRVEAMRRPVRAWLDGAEAAAAAATSKRKTTTTTTTKAVKKAASPAKKKQKTSKSSSSSPSPSPVAKKKTPPTKKQPEKQQQRLSDVGVALGAVDGWLSQLRAAAAADAAPQLVAPLGTLRAHLHASLEARGDAAAAAVHLSQAVGVLCMLRVGADDAPLLAKIDFVASLLNKLVK